MKSKVVTGTVLALLFMSMLTLAFKIQPVKAFSEETVVDCVWNRIANRTTSWNNTDPKILPKIFYSGVGNLTFSPPDANGVVNLTCNYGPIEPLYEETLNLTQHVVPMSDWHGKLFTNDSVGDVDIISMTNDTGMFFKNWTDGTWHPPGEEWLGNGTTDPAGSAWFSGVWNISTYLGNGTGGLLLGSYLAEMWFTTGFSENTVVEPASRLNGFYVNATGVPFSSPYVGSNGTFVSTRAQLNIPYFGEHLDIQTEAEDLIAIPPVFTVSLFSPANLYVTDPENRHIGTHPTTGEYVNEIPGAFYSGPESEHQRIVVPNPLDGVYDIKIVGTSSGEYTLVVELATVEKMTTHTYTGNISVGETLESQATISEGEMTSTQPVLVSPVGGIYIPVNKLGLLAPYIGLTILSAVAVITVAYAKKRKNKVNIMF